MVAQQGTGKQVARGWSTSAKAGESLLEGALVGAHPTALAKASASLDSLLSFTY